MSKSTSRRAILAGLAAAPVAAVPAVAAAAPDPVLAAIENHKRALLASFVTGRLYCVTNRDDHRKADRESWQAMDRAGHALIDTQPTTAAGAVALLQYVVSVNSHEIGLPAEPPRFKERWSSSPVHWPFFDDIDESDEGIIAINRLIGNAVKALAGKAVA
jgi:hypothetical protein